MSKKLKPVGRELEHKPVIIECQQVIITWKFGSDWHTRFVETGNWDGYLYISINDRSFGTAKNRAK